MKINIFKRNQSKGGILKAIHNKQPKDGILKAIHRHVSLNVDNNGKQISDKFLKKSARTGGGYALAAAGAVGGRQAAIHLPGKVGQFLEKKLPEKMTAPVKDAIYKIDPKARYIARQVFIEASTFGGFLAPSAILRKLSGFLS